ncbi:MAG: hypothetical protein ACLFQX_00745 [Candidatus Kapaibacterium sp.]
MATPNMFQSLRLTFADLARWAKANPDRADDALQFMHILLLITLTMIVVLTDSPGWLPLIAAAGGLVSRYISRVLIRSLPYLENSPKESVMLENGRFKDY